jgi:hypothetical protein
VFPRACPVMLERNGRLLPLESESVPVTVLVPAGTELATVMYRTPDDVPLRTVNPLTRDPFWVTGVARQTVHMWQKACRESATPLLGLVVR